MANQPPHHSWRKRARRAAAGEKQGEQWPDHGREGSWHRLVTEEMMEEEGWRLWLHNSSPWLWAMFLIFCEGATAEK